MNAIQFFKQVCSVAPIAVQPFWMKAGESSVIFNGAIAGLKYHQYQAVYHLIKNDVELEIRRELNDHDYNAVGVYFRGIKLGFLPMSDNHEVAQLLERGFSLKAIVTQAIREKWSLAREIQIQILNVEL